MKKLAKKLILSRETLRNLEPQALQRVVAGVEQPVDDGGSQYCTIPVSNCAGTCASCPGKC